MKIRVYEIAREMGKSHDSMVAICKHLNCEIKGAMSSLSSEDEQRVRDFVKNDDNADYEILTREKSKSSLMLAIENSPRAKAELEDLLGISLRD